MTGIEVSPGCDGKIFRSAAAAAESLVDAGAAAQIDHEMEECKSSAFLLSLEHLPGENIILFTDHRDVFGTDRVRGVSRSNDRLHGQLVKPEIREMKHILSEIKIVVGKSSADVILFSEGLPLGCKLPELRNDQIVAAFAVP